MTYAGTCKVEIHLKRQKLRVAVDMMKFSLGDCVFFIFGRNLQC